MEDEAAFAAAAKFVGYDGAMPANRTRYFKQLVHLASEQVAAVPGAMSRTCSPVKLVSSASHASACHPPGSKNPAAKDLRAVFTADLVDDSVPAAEDALIPAVDAAVVETSGTDRGATAEEVPVGGSSQTDLSELLDRSPEEAAAVSAEGAGGSSTPA